MSRFLATLAIFVVGICGCSKTSEVSDSALPGNWSSGCLVASSATSGGPLSQKVSINGLAQSSPATAAVTKFTDSACTAVYSSALYTFTESMTQNRVSSNSFSVPMNLVKVSFVPNTADALAEFTRDAKSQDATFDDRSLKVGDTIDATDKTEKFKTGTVTCTATFQYYDSPDQISEKQMELSCKRPINEQLSIVIIPYSKVQKQ